MMDNRSQELQLFRPSVQVENNLEKQAMEHVLESYPPKKYTDSKIINTAIKRCLAFYEAHLTSTLPTIASTDTLKSVISEYDKYVKAFTQQSDYSGTQPLTMVDDNFRRYIRYLIERIATQETINNHEGTPDNSDQLLGECWFCAKRLVQLSQRSEATHRLFPNETVLVVSDSTNPEQAWFHLSLEEHSQERCNAYLRRMDIDSSRREKVLDEKKLLFSIKRLGDVIDPVFKNEFGVSLSCLFNFFHSLASMASPTNASEVICHLQNDLGVDEASALKLLEGFLLRQSTAQHRCDVTKPNRQYQLKHRPILECVHGSEPTLLWSKKQLTDALFESFKQLAFGKIPQEWKTTGVQKAVGKYNKAITKLFEDTVIDAMQKTGWAASRFKSKIGQGKDSISIPDHIGEIDLIAYCEKEQLLVVGDAKVVKSTEEPRMYSDDLDKFIHGSKNYVNQTNTKTNWVMENIPAVSRALESSSDFPDFVSVKQIAPLLVTYYPAFSSHFIDDITCVSLTELICDINENGKWPYPHRYNVDTNHV